MATEAEAAAAAAAEAEATAKAAAESKQSEFETINIPTSTGEIIPIKSRDELLRAATIGVEKVMGDIRAKEQSAAASVKEVKEEIKEAKKEGDPTSALEKRLAAAEAKLAQAEEREKNAQIFSQIDRGVTQSGLTKEWHDEAKDKVITLLATNKQLTVEGAIQQATDYWKKKAGQFTPKVNVEEKEEEKKKLGPSTPSGTRSGEEQTKPLGRKSFRDGSLAARITESVKKAVNED